ncbi:putative cis-zeatin O-glucosyltransferase [Iris pallida]|uniref:Cis-zeatin O-glucosyltransferase n=1 Tax=Iris pallida TaxID=29817 RepID=A0AAX6FHC8_IRIPA|nr:putative cis-zeatin O-glucosyltransferase [Iris pallida]
MELRAPLAALFLSLSVGCRRLVVVHDPMMSFVSSDVASLPNAESYRFQCVPSYNQLHHFCRQPDYDASRLRREVLDVILDPFEGCFSPEFRAFVVNNYIDVAAEAGTLFNSCRPVDGEFLDLLSGVPRYRGKKLFAVGPLNPLAIERGLSSHKCLEWLDEQPPASVLYVSFGSTSTMSDEQIERLATGLERSGQRFIWVLRDADLGDIFAADGDGGNGIGRRELPAGFEERVEGRGGGGEGVGAAASDPSPPFHGRVHEPLRVELVHGEPEHGSADRSLAHALGPAEERGDGDRILEDGCRGAGVGSTRGSGVVGGGREGDREGDGGAVLRRGGERGEEESSAAGRSHTPLRGRGWVFQS